MQLLNSVLVLYLYNDEFFSIWNMNMNSYLSLVNKFCKIIHYEKYQHIDIYFLIYSKISIAK